METGACCKVVVFGGDMETIIWIDSLVADIEFYCK